MKYLRYAGALAAAIAAFAAGMFYFAPLDSGGLYAIDAIRLSAAQRGVYMTYDDLRRSGRVYPSYQIKDVGIDASMVRISISSLKVRPRLLSSALRGAARLEIEFGGAEIAMLPNNKFSVGRGSLTIEASGTDFKILGANVEGDIGAKGDITYNIAQGAITDSTMSISAPDSVSAMLGGPLTGRYLERGEQGEWRVRKNAAQNR
jgi:hypothetical protein